MRRDETLLLFRFFSFSLQYYYQSQSLPRQINSQIRKYNSIRKKHSTLYSKQCACYISVILYQHLQIEYKTVDRIRRFGKYREKLIRLVKPKTYPLYAIILPCPSSSPRSPLVAPSVSAL